ncbi:MAG TPA: HD domain-containing protein [Burkholderiaceae bacterium]|nr:HD domain-containing protein [Burkholderiaceae bacterium]
MALGLEDIEPLFAAKGSRMYAGEPVTQLQHALQSAQLAEQSGADAALIVAALLHDLGHMVNDQGETPTLRGIDDRHEYVALPFLRGLFDEAVLQPIRLHVDAKRYLCARGHVATSGIVRGAQYWANLSADSKRSLELQGGIFTDAEAQRFIAQPYAAGAVSVRLWDDAAKIEDAATPPLAHYMALAETIALRR